MNIFSKLEQVVDLTDNEKILVQYMQDNTDEFIQMSAEDISKKCYISISTIYRLCRKLEVSGLSELKVHISASIENHLKEEKQFNYNYPFKQNETQYQITHKLKDVYEQTITSTINLLDLEQLRLVALKMNKAKYIDIYTSAGNIYFAENFKFQMQEIGKSVNVPLEEYQQRLAATISDQTHIALIISFGGRGSSMSAITKLLKKTKTPIVLICSTLDNPLKPYADYILYMSSYEDHYNKISSFATRLSLLYILDSIYTCYFKLDYDKNIKNKLSYYETMIQYK